MALYSEYFPSKFLRLDDLRGHQTRLKIASVLPETVGKDQKLVVYFHRTEKALVLNRTNGSLLARTFGDNTEKWIGQEVILSVGTSDFNGVEMLTVRIPRGAEPLPRTPADEMSDEIPF